MAGKKIPRERELRWLPGYRGASPVRVGNAARHQRQLDVFGEVADCLHQAGVLGKHSNQAFTLLTSVLKWLEHAWRAPDHGLWEVRSVKRQFTHSKVMCWVAFDRTIRAAEELGLDAPLEEWRRIRQEIHETVCRKAFNTKLQSFVRFYGSEEVDASLLLLPLVGFLPPEDRRIVGTVRLIEKNLTDHCLVRRNRQMREGAFLPGSCWLADYYELAGKTSKARKLLTQVLRLRNDLGMLSEEYDFRRRRLRGNFPQALSHVALANTIINHRKWNPSRQRSQGKSFSLFL